MVLAATVDGSSLKTILLSIECIASLINFVIFGHLFYQIYGTDCLKLVGWHKRQSIDDVDSDRITVQTTKIFSTSAAFSCMLTTLFLIFHHSATSESLHNASIIISDISWTIGQLSAYFLWITNLYWTFHGSVHQLSNRFFYGLSSLAIIFAIGIGSVQILTISQNRSDSKQLFVLYATISIVVCVIDLILSSLVIYTFLSKLHDLTAHCRSNWTQILEDHQQDVQTIKMVKAESAHFKTERKSLKMKRNTSKKMQLMIVCSFLLIFTCVSTFSK